jgi:aminoglycoside phosphotransferase (APT) family kinase protein
MAWSKPETPQIRAALREYAPQLTGASIEFLGEGWEFWAFRAGDLVLRFPMSERGFVWKLGNQSSTQSLQIERSLTPALADTLPVPIAVTQVFGDSGPNGAPFAGHRFIPGELPGLTDRQPARSFGRDLGDFIAKLHAFPASKALDLGVPLFDGPRLRQDRVAHYEKVIRIAFPLLSCEARTHVERTYEAYLNDSASFDFEPVLVHTDLHVNTLIDDDGSLCGVIDFGDSAISSPALDFWPPAYGFAQLGLASQETDCLQAAGVEAEALGRMRPELEFLDVRYPLLGILHGLGTGDDDIVDEGIRNLNAMLPRDLVCAEDGP